MLFWNRRQKMHLIVFLWDCDLKISADGLEDINKRKGLYYVLAEEVDG